VALLEVKFLRTSFFTDDGEVGIFIFLAVMSFNFLGDHLRDRLDPSNRK
jgi:hypothetical protein